MNAIARPSVIIDTSVFMGILPVRNATRVVAPTRHKPGESRWRWDQLSLGQNDSSAQFAPSVAVSDLLSIVHFMGLEESLLMRQICPRCEGKSGFLGTSRVIGAFVSARSQPMAKKWVA